MHLERALTIFLEAYCDEATWEPVDCKRVAGIVAGARRLVTLYGTAAEGSPAIGAAGPTHAAADDILGNPRPAGLVPDVGAFEYQSYGFTPTAAPPSGGSKTIQ